MHLSLDELERGLDEIRRAPQTQGTVDLLVVRPAVDERTVLDEARLDLVVGMVGDTWRERGSRMTPDGSAHPDMQLNLMNSRVCALLAQNPQRWALAGDQLYVDLDLSHDNLPAGTWLALGSAVIEITDRPHRGCAKFAQRFGRDALRFVNSPAGVALRLRGVNARVVRSGTVRRGQTIAVMHPAVR